MVKSLRQFEYFTVLLKNKNFTSKIKRSKVADYAALKTTLMWIKFKTGLLEAVAKGLFR